MHSLFLVVIVDNLDACAVICFSPEGQGCGPEFFHDYHIPPTSTAEQLEYARKRIQELEALVEKLEVEKFGLERFSRDPSLIRFYTGFPSYELLKAFYAAISPHAAVMIRWTQVQRKRLGKAKEMYDSFNQKLQLIDQLFLFLHKVRVGSLDLDLADKFSVSQSTVSRNTVTWANFLYCILGCQPLWPSRYQVRKYMPAGFKEMYPLVRVILDCTELKVQSPSSLTLNSETYSSYKGSTTLKGLVGIAPSGVVTFVSLLFSGCISDKHITKASGVLDLLEPGDQVMVDKGFLIQEELAAMGCSLVIPNFLAAKGQFSVDEVSENEAIAHLRVHVERAIRRFREFHIFDSIIPLTMAGSINQIWSVCCLLTNFQGPLIRALES